MPSTTATAAGEAIAEMVRDRRLDGVVRSLATKYSAPLALVEDAVSIATAKVLRRAEEHEIQGMVPYFYRSADNALKTLLKKEGKYAGLRDDYDEEDERIHDVADVDGANLLKWLKSLTKDWPDHLRVATNLVLDYAFSEEWDEPTAEQLAQELEDTLLEPVSAVNARKWKSRGLARLRAEISAMYEQNDPPQKGSIQ